MVGVCVAQALVRVCLYIHLLIFKTGSLPGLGSPSRLSCLAKNPQASIYPALGLLTRTTSSPGL